MFDPATAKRGDKVMAEDDEATFIAFVPEAMKWQRVVLLSEDHEIFTLPIDRISLPKRKRKVRLWTRAYKCETDPNPCVMSSLEMGDGHVFDDDRFEDSDCVWIEAAPRFYGEVEVDDD